MTARDWFDIGLKCPDCGKSGKAHMSENDGASYVFGQRDRKVEDVPEGFTVVDHGSNHGETTRFQCECGSFIPS